MFSRKSRLIQTFLETPENLFKITINIGTRQFESNNPKISQGYFPGIQNPSKTNQKLKLGSARSKKPAEK
jgi:hypothetical protein